MNEPEVEQPAPPSSAAEMSDGLLPLLKLGPDQPPAPPPEDPPPGTPTFRRTQFGYDVRVVGKSADVRQLPAPPSARPRPYRLRAEVDRRLYLGTALLLLVGAVGVIAFQPAAREAVSHLFHSAPAPSPSAAGHLVFPVATPPPATPTVPAPPVHLTASYSVFRDGGTSTTCTQGVTAPGNCHWTATLLAGYPLYISVNATGQAAIDITVNDHTTGKVLRDLKGTGPLYASLVSPPTTIDVALQMTSASGTNVDIALSTTPPNQPA